MRARHPDMREGCTMRVLIADENDIVRRGIRSVLEKSTCHEICAEAADAASTIEITKTINPDVVILDYLPNYLGGAAIVSDIRCAHPYTQIMILTQYVERDLMRETLEAGARAYLLKSEAVDHMLLALDALASGRTYFSTTVSTSLIEEWASAP
ncbi:response regulator [Methylobacterium sp. ID0610]|uniref:response regulator n=1 Tax=Methylobacterium carpenticola TaxID=3344827 RepID=UPI00367D91AE